MATLKNKLNAQAALYAGYEFAGASAQAVEKIKTALAEKQDAKAVRADFIVGHMAYATQVKDISKAFGLARVIFEATGKDSTAQATRRRDEQEERMYGAARKAWSRVASLAGIVADKRGGARKEAGKASKAKAAAKETSKAKSLPVAKDTAQAVAQVRNMALMLSTYCAKNKDVIGADLSAIVAEFVGKVNKIA